MRAGAPTRHLVGRLGVAAVVLGAAVVRAEDTPPVPWPGGAAPTDETVQAWLEEAATVGLREYREEVLSAIEPGEGSTSLAVSQADVDRQVATNDQLFILGDSLFGHEFTSFEGYGDGPDRKLRRIHRGKRGGLDAHSCAACHSVGGVDGAGSETQRAFLDGDGERESSALPRIAPQVIGAGFVQILGAEMSRDLAFQRERAVREARDLNQAVTVQLVTKGVSFGSLKVGPDGTVDTSQVTGVSPDLVVRPFGWKGSVATLRRFAEDAARVHFGIQSSVLAEGNRARPDPAKLGAGPVWYDPDGDGFNRELEEGSLSAVAVYMAMLESPIVLPPTGAGLRERWARGSALFDEVGCSSCHRRELPTVYAVWREMPDTTGGPGQEVAVLDDGDRPKSGTRVFLFSDLKRHDMGPELADTRPTDDVPANMFLTRPLWGLADTAPYLHDGRAATIRDAIELHGGEASASRDRYRALAPDAQGDLQVFLLSLARAQRLHQSR